MSRSATSRRTSRPEADPARVFAALGDRTRLALVARLRAGAPPSIAELSAGAGISRQAITKHLDVLERAGVVEGLRSGRERRFHLRPAPIAAAQAHLAEIAAQWDDALDRLASFVEE